MEQIYDILLSCGFEDLAVIQEPVTDAYANKWGHDLDLKQYIERGKILAVKPRV